MSRILIVILPTPPTTTHLHCGPFYLRACILCWRFTSEIVSVVAGPAQAATVERWEEEAEEGGCSQLSSYRECVIPDDLSSLQLPS